jgi:hypothetical protein
LAGGDEAEEDSGELDCWRKVPFIGKLCGALHPFPPSGPNFTALPQIPQLPILRKNLSTSLKVDSFHQLGLSYKFLHFILPLGITSRVWTP